MRVDPHVSREGTCQKDTHPYRERDCRARIVGKSVVPGELSETVTTPHGVARKKKKKKRTKKDRKRERCKETNSQQNKKDKGER